jgi:hypothetical protein
MLWKPLMSNFMKHQIFSNYKIVTCGQREKCGVANNHTIEILHFQKFRKQIWCEKIEFPSGSRMSLEFCQAKPCAQERLDTFQLGFTGATNEWVVRALAAGEVIRAHCILWAEKWVTIIWRLVKVLVQLQRYWHWLLGEYTMKNLLFFEWHRRLKAGWDNEKVTPRRGQQTMQRTYAPVDRLRTLVRSYWWLGVRLIAEEVNMNWETVRQIIMEELEMSIFSTKVMRRVLTDEENNVGFLTMKSISKLDHPPYSPSLVQWDFCLFPK